MDLHFSGENRNVRPSFQEVKVICENLEKTWFDHNTTTNLKVPFPFFSSPYSF